MKNKYNVFDYWFEVGAILLNVAWIIILILGVVFIVKNMEIAKDIYEISFWSSLFILILFKRPLTLFYDFLMEDVYDKRKT